MSARPGVPLVPPGPAICPHTANLSAAIARDAAAVYDLLGQLVAAGPKEVHTLVAMQALVARMGWLADTVAQAHGGEPLNGGVSEWLLQNAEAATAFDVLDDRIAVAAIRR
jgi:hypothetical protein